MQKVLDYIRDRLASGESTTLIDIAHHCGWSSPATAADVVDRLRAWNLVRRKKKGRTAIYLMAAAANYEEKTHGPN